jgi:broad specificity phosphatase PhoE
MPRVVHLVRHGEVENPGGVIYGTLPGFVLSERGRKQVSVSAARLSAMVSGPVAVVSSPLERAKESAKIVHEVLRARGVDAITQASPPSEIACDERVIEARSWTEGLPRRFAPRAFVSRWLDKSARAEDEAPRAVAERMREAILDAVRDAQDREVVLVSHQFPIWMAQVAFAYKLGTPDAHALAKLVPWLFLRRRCSLASITTLELEGEELAKTRYWEPPS